MSKEGRGLMGINYPIQKTLDIESILKETIPQYDPRLFYEFRAEPGLDEPVYALTVFIKIGLKKLRKDMTFAESAWDDFDAKFIADLLVKFVEQVLEFIEDDANDTA